MSPTHDLIVAIWPDGSEIRRTGRMDSHGRVVLEYYSPDSYGISYARIPVGASGPETTGLGHFTFPNSDLTRAQRWMNQRARRRILWLLASTTVPAAPRTVHESVAALGVPQRMDPEIADLIDGGASPGDVIAAGEAVPYSASYRDGSKGLVLDAGYFDLQIIRTNDADYDPSPEAQEAVARWQESHPPDDPADGPGAPPWCVVGPSCDGSLLSVGETPWEALRACRLLIWPGREEEWAAAWTEPGELVLPSREMVDLCLLLGEVPPLWLSQSRWTEWLDEQ